LFTVVTINIIISVAEGQDFSFWTENKPLFPMPPLLQLFKRSIVEEDSRLYIKSPKSNNSKKVYKILYQFWLDDSHFPVFKQLHVFGVLGAVKV